MSIVDSSGAPLRPAADTKAIVQHQAFFAELSKLLAENRIVAMAGTILVRNDKGGIDVRNFSQDAAGSREALIGALHVLAGIFARMEIESQIPAFQTPQPQQLQAFIADQVARAVVADRMRGQQPGH